MATEQFVLSTLGMRLQQCDVLLEWLIVKNPHRDSLQHALDSLKLTELLIYDMLAVESE